jgi:hypothetical protein
MSSPTITQSKVFYRPIEAAISASVMPPVALVGVRITLHMSCLAHISVVEPEYSGRIRQNQMYRQRP